MSVPRLRELLAEVRGGESDAAGALIAIDSPIARPRRDEDEDADLRAGSVETTAVMDSDWSQMLAVSHAERDCLPLRPGRRAGKLSLTVGRSSTCDLVVSHVSTSKLHATLLVDRVSGEFELVDNDSSNGTYVDGERLAPRAPREVYSGQRLAFGKDMFVLVDRATLLQLARV